MKPEHDGHFAAEHQRAYLHLLARSQLRSGANHAVDASDIVQQTLLHAHQKREQFRGQTEAEFRGWLRQILAHVIADAFRKRVPKAILDDLNKSAAQLNHFLQSQPTSPSQKVERGELLDRLLVALEALPEGERTALELRHFVQPPWPLEKIAKHLGRPTPKAVASLLHRGLERLRAALSEELKEN